MAIENNALIESKLDMRRFLDKNNFNLRDFQKEDGSIDFPAMLSAKRTSLQPISCWEVVERILKIFNCKLKQHKGEWWIVNYHELNSPVWKFSWDTLEQLSKEMNNHVVNATNLKFDGTYIEQQKIVPFNAVHATFYTQDALGEDITGRDLSKWTTAWTKRFTSYDYPSTGVITAYTNNYSNDNMGALPLESVPINTMDLSAPVSLSFNTQYRRLVIKFDAKLEINSVMHGDNPGVKLAVYVYAKDVMFDGNRWKMVYVKDLSENWAVNTAETSIDFILSGNELDGSAIYAKVVQCYVRFALLPIKTDYLPWEYVQFSMRNISITSDKEKLFDRGFYQKLNNSSTKKYQPIIYVGEARQVTYIGGILNYDEATETWSTVNTWNSYNHNEGIGLVDIYARNILNNRAKYKNFLRATIHDRDNLIDFNSILIIEGRYYVFSSYSRDYKESTVNGDLIELLTERKIYTPIVEKVLNTIGGSEITDVLIRDEEDDPANSNNP